MAATRKWTRGARAREPCGAFRGAGSFNALERWRWGCCCRLDRMRRGRGAVLDGSMRLGWPVLWLAKAGPLSSLAPRTAAAAPTRAQPAFFFHPSSTLPLSPSLSAGHLHRQKVPLHWQRLHSRSHPQGDCYVHEDDAHHCDPPRLLAVHQQVQVRDLPRLSLRGRSQPYVYSPACPTHPLPYPPSAFHRSRRYEKRHKTISAHCSPCFLVKDGDVVTVGQCRPLSKTVRFNVLKVESATEAGAARAKKTFRVF